MKVTNILTMMGSGVVLAFSGVICLMAAAALGVNAAFPDMPSWVSFLIIGVVATGVGLFLLSRSGEETSRKIEKVERKLTLQEFWRKKPWLMLGASVATGFVAHRIIRVLFTTDAKAPPVPDSFYEAEALYERQMEEEQERAKESEPSNVKDFLMKPLKELARYATTRAITLGTQMIAAPFIMKAVQSFVEKNNLNQAGQYPPGPNGQQSRSDYSHADGNGTHRF